MTRISNLAVEFQISSNRIIETLNKFFLNKSYSINEKLNENEITILRKEFRLDPNEKLNRFKQVDFYIFEIDNQFNFTDKEISKFGLDYIKYVSLINDIENLKFRNNKYWGLDEDEVNAILRIKYLEIEEIQSKIEIQREEIQEIIENIKKANEERDDLKIHREAKSVENWNID